MKYTDYLHKTMAIRRVTWSWMGRCAAPAEVKYFDLPFLKKMNRNQFNPFETRNLQNRLQLTITKHWHGLFKYISVFQYGSVTVVVVSPVLMVRASVQNTLALPTKSRVMTETNTKIVKTKSEKTRKNGIHECSSVADQKVGRSTRCSNRDLWSQNIWLCHVHPVEHPPQGYPGCWGPAQLQKTS